MRAAIAERLDHRGAEAARTAGHENDFASEIERDQSSATLGWNQLPAR